MRVHWLQLPKFLRRNPAPEIAPAVERTVMSESTRTIEPKPHRVKGPDGKLYYAYAPTKQGAIKAVRDSLPKPEEAWSAEVLTTQELISLGRQRVKIINDPDPVADNERDTADQAENENRN